MIGYRTIGAAFFLMAVAAPAGAQTLKADPQAIAGFLRGQGLSPVVKADTDGDPLIEAQISENNKFSVYFYNCTEHKDCTTLQFYAGYTDSKMDASKLNEWNRTKRFGRAYIDNVGDPVVEMDIDMTGGMPSALFADNYRFWKILMKDFPAFIYKE